jgi:hypothetical protein
MVLTSMMTLIYDETLERQEQSWSDIGWRPVVKMANLLGHFKTSTPRPARQLMNPVNESLILQPGDELQELAHDDTIGSKRTTTTRRRLVEPFDSDMVDPPNIQEEPDEVEGAEDDRHRRRHRHRHNKSRRREEADDVAEVPVSDAAPMPQNADGTADAHSKNEDVAGDGRDHDENVKQKENNVVEAPRNPDEAVHQNETEAEENEAVKIEKSDVVAIPDQVEGLENHEQAAQNFNALIKLIGGKKEEAWQPLAPEASDRPQTSEPHEAEEGWVPSPNAGKVGTGRGRRECVCA